MLHTFRWNAGFIRNHGLYFGNLFRNGWTAVSALELVAVVVGRVVACRDHDPGFATQFKGPQRNHGSRHKALRQLNMNAHSAEHASRGFSKQLTTKTAIVTYYYRWLIAHGFEPLCSGNSDSRYVIRGILTGNDGSPSIGAELNGNWLHGNRVLALVRKSWGTS